MLKYADESLEEDKEVVLAPVAQDGFALMYADERLRRLLSQELQAERFFDKGIFENSPAPRCVLRSQQTNTETCTAFRATSQQMKPLLFPSIHASTLGLFDAP